MHCGLRVTSMHGSKEVGGSSSSTAPTNSKGTGRKGADLGAVLPPRASGPRAPGGTRADAADDVDSQSEASAKSGAEPSRGEREKDITTKGSAGV